MRWVQRTAGPCAALNALRAVLLVVFIDGDNLWALAVSGAFFYALTIVTILISWWLIKRALPADHLGIRHPRIRSEHTSDELGHSG